MDITSTEAISFNLFYLTEFLNITLSKIEGKIADSHFKLLKKISTYLVKEDTIVEGLEKLAKYQQTNDLAIFLFDMVERANDYGAKVVYNTLPDLAEDFLNLYSLMVEDDECVKTLQLVVDSYENKFGEEEKEKQLDEFEEMSKPKADAQEEEPQPELSFNEFYLTELLDKVGQLTDSGETGKDKTKVCGLLVNLTKIEEDYSPAIKKIGESLQSILPTETNPASILYKNIDSNAAVLESLVSDFRKNEKEEFESILNSGEILPVIIEKQEEEKIVAKDKPADKKSDLDSLLVQYFKSEVEENYNDLKPYLEKDLQDLNSKKNIQYLVKKFKALKEVSMIHGYSGLEYIAQLLSAQFSDLCTSENGLSDKSVKILSGIYTDLLSVENYADKDHGQKNVDAIKKQISKLGDSFKPLDKEETSTKQEVVPEPELVAEIKPETEEAIEPSFGIDDKEDFEKIIQSFFKTISKGIFECHNNLDSTDHKTTLRQTLDLVQNNSAHFHEQLAPKIIDPLNGIYNTILQSGKDTPAETIDSLESVWNILSGTPISKVDFDSLNSTLNDLSGPEQETLSGIEDKQTVDAFLESALKEWSKQKELLKNTLSSGANIEPVQNYLAGLGNNLSVLGYSNYSPFVDFVKEQVDKSVNKPLDEEIATEIENAFNLFLERMQHQGKNGNCTDILAVLYDITSEETVSEPSENQQVEQETAVEEETIAEAKPEKAVEAEEEKPEKIEEVDDDLALFREDTKEHLKIIHENLDAFSNSKERQSLVEIENACHSIRSSAHFLNFKDISKFAAAIEDAAELFGKSEFAIPKDLDTSLSKGVETLESLIEDPEFDFSETMEMLEALLDNVAIEDVGTSGDDQFGFDNIDKDKDAGKQKVEEKPLFAEGAEEDEELLEIFREESTTFLSNISESNKILLDKPDDEEAVEKMSYASHSLKSASKMLGFREISQITDGLELLTEAIINDEISHSPELHAKIDEAVNILTKLSEGESLGAEKITGIIFDLEVDNWTEEEVTEDETSEDELPENMVTIFIEEARELTAGLNDDYLELEKMPESEMILSNILRRMHTLKGSSYISKYNLIGDLAHKLEDYFSLYTQKETSIKNEMINTAFVALDLTTDMVDSIEKNGTEKVDQFTTRLAEIDNRMFAFQNFAEAATSTAPESDMQPIPVSDAPQKKKSTEDNIIKISTEYMDKLVDMASELMINQTQLGSHLHSLKDILNDIEGEKKQIHGAENVLEDAIEFGVLGEQDSENVSSEKKDQIRKMSGNIKDVVRAVNMIHGDLNKLSEGFEQNIGRLASISKLLHSDMLKTRMVPVDNLFNRYPRAVRDMAQKQKKKVNLIIEDNNTEMDRAMVEGLAEPILHIIRNAIDHGLETPQERTKSEKSESGTLLLKARQEKNQIIIEITDDGRGIDIESVRKKIVEKGLSEKKLVDKMSEAEILDYIFVAGFSTRDEATDVSGRGIGLDSVSNQIQKLKGNIRIKTEAGTGTSFSLRVPLTLVISQALMVKVDLQSIAIPVIAVQETIEFNTPDIITDEDKKYIRVRGRLLPYIYLGDILKFGEDKDKSERNQQMAVVIYDAGISMALGIDELVGRQEVVIKSLGTHLQNVDYISGGTILANGDVALILDFALVIRTIEMHYFGKVAERQVTKKTTVKKETKPAKKTTAPKSTKRKPKKAEETKKEKAEDTKAPTKTVKKRTIKSRKPKVLIVDDSNSVRNFVGSILERNGFLTIKSTNGADALEKMKTEKVDLMITDLEMPKMHGFDLISNIRKEKKHDSLPIIILTGRAGMKHRQTGEELGANAFIVKPFKEKDLLHSLSEFISTGQ
ncbi:MAG: response regulator [Calditrichaeota bacterium]|nr:MAG: response regulator [Calditrichota bacterium]MBL1204991.1 response regulator [Calditrichota bacterium]NOG44821.1 response regulator [Calditrichota bacterium]